MPTDAVNGRLKSAFVVLSSIDEFRSRVVPKLAARPVPEGQPMVNHDEFLDSLRGQLVWSYNNLFQKDFNYAQEIADDQKYFDDREDASRDLRHVMIDGRGIFEHCYRPANISEFGFPNELARDAEGLYQQGRHLDQRLREPDLPVPTPWSAKLVVGALDLADEVSPRVARLEAVLAHVRQEKKELTTAQMARNEAIQHFDQTFVWVSNTCESLFSLAGEKELARRVRPSSTRPGRTEEDPDSSLEGNGQTPPDFEGADPDEPLPGSEDPADETDPPPPAGEDPTAP